MDDNLKQTITRVFLLLFIAAMLGLIVVKINSRKNVVEKILGAVTPTMQSESGDSRTVSQNGVVPQEGLTMSADSRRVIVTSTKSEDTPRTLPDGSKLIRMEDGYGNSSVTRSFRNDKLLRMVLVRYDRKGPRGVFAYGRNGRVETLPEDYIDKALTASSSEIAAKAKIYDSVNANQRRDERLSLVRERRRQEIEDQRRLAARVYVETGDISKAEETSRSANETEIDSVEQD